VKRGFFGLGLMLALTPAPRVGLVLWHDAHPTLMHKAALGRHTRQLRLGLFLYVDHRALYIKKIKSRDIPV
jgi:hypothetical protein